jgi:hypothetical protein
MGTGPLRRYRLHLPDLASYHLSLAANAHVGGIHHEVYSRVLQRGLLNREGSTNREMD